MDEPMSIGEYADFMVRSAMDQCRYSEVADFIADYIERNGTYTARATDIGLGMSDMDVLSQELRALGLDAVLEDDGWFVVAEGEHSGLVTAVAK